jgi:hypothetical protein
MLDETDRSRVALNATGQRLAYLSPDGREIAKNSLRGRLQSYDRVDRTETEVIERQRAAS